MAILPHAVVEHGHGTGQEFDRHRLALCRAGAGYGLARKHLRAHPGRMAQLDRNVAAQSSCARLELEGGWYAILRVPVTGSDDDLAIDLLTTQGIYVHPGHFYDFPTDGYLIISLITPADDFDEGLRRVLSVF